MSTTQLALLCSLAIVASSCGGSGTRGRQPAPGFSGATPRPAKGKNSPMGPATRAGCEGQCVQGNMPCTGCFGPTGRVRDYGAKILSAIASTVGSDDENEIIDILDKIPDPVGTFYRYSLPASLLRRRKMEPVTADDG